MWPFVCGWLNELVRECIRHALPCRHDTDYSLCLMTFKCMLLMMRGGTLSILGHGVKSQGQLWH